MSLVYDILNTYNRTEHITDTAKICGVSLSKARKVLVTYGIYPTDLTLRINNLYQSGSSPHEIATRLNINVKTVLGHLPYTKCMYNADHPTINAMRIRRTRKNKMIVYRRKEHDKNQGK